MFCSDDLTQTLLSLFSWRIYLVEGRDIDKVFFFFVGWIDSPGSVQ